MILVFRTHPNSRIVISVNIKAEVRTLADVPAVKIRQQAGFGGSETARSIDGLECLDFFKEKGDYERTTFCLKDKTVYSLLLTSISKIPVFLEHEGFISGWLVER